MKIAEYVQSLLPRISTSSVEKDLANVRSELRDHTLPPFDSMQELMSDWRFKDNWTKDFDKAFDKEVKTRLRGNYLIKTHEILKNTQDTINTLEKLVDKKYAKDVVRSAMSYQQSSILQLVESISFASKYARKLLIRTLGLETSLYRNNSFMGKELTKKEIQWLDDNRHLFFLTMRALNHKPKDVEKMIGEIPDVEVDPDNHDNVVAVSGAKKLDPFGLSTFGLIMNPIYHIRIQITEWQVARYEAAKEERKMLEYQILDLRKALDEEHDPKLEQALEYTQDRVARLNYKIHKMEEKAA